MGSRSAHSGIFWNRREPRGGGAGASIGGFGEDTVLREEGIEK